MILANYAVNQTKGRKYSENPPTERNEFQRDLARIIHSSAFRRLEYKTQVFVNDEGDLYRTRLTHSIEVAQIARSVARSLCLNQDLTESLALAHDLGHTPFGHAGQDALNQCMTPYGGFEHNFQSLRVVDKLEERYIHFGGLNLCFETRVGILKHCSLENARHIGEIGQRFIDKKQAPLEAQLVDIADALAYNSHDVDDGLRSGLLSLEQMLSHDMFADIFNQLCQKHPHSNERILIHETIRRMIGELIGDLIAHTKTQIKNHHIGELSQVADAPKLVSFSDDVHRSHLALKKLLRTYLYKHQKIKAMTDKAEQIIYDLFGFYIQYPELLPPMHHRVLDLQNEQKVARACADYIAGMTDRFADKTWQRLKAH